MLQQVQLVISTAASHIHHSASHCLPLLCINHALLLPHCVVLSDTAEQLSSSNMTAALTYYAVDSVASNKMLLHYAVYCVMGGHSVLTPLRNA